MLQQIADGVRAFANDADGPLAAARQLDSALRELADASTRLTGAEASQVRTATGGATASAHSVAVQLESFQRDAIAFADRLASGQSGGSVDGGASTNGAGAAGEGAGGELDSVDLAALSDYTGDGYSEINRALRKGDPAMPGVSKRAEAISTALAKLPDHHGQVFRGTDLTAEQIASYVPGEFRVEAAFTSTTSAAEKAFGGNVLFIIDSSHGKSVEGYSNVPFESEVLFDRGARFYVHQNRFDPSVSRYLIVLKEV